MAVANENRVEKLFLLHIKQRNNFVNLIQSMVLKKKDQFELATLNVLLIRIELFFN